MKRGSVVLTLLVFLFAAGCGGGGGGSSSSATPPPSITTASLPDGVRGEPYPAGTNLLASGGVTPYTWDNVTPLPPGITLDSSGTLSGTPASHGKFDNITFSVTDFSGTVVTKNIPIRVLAPLVLFVADNTNLSINIFDNAHVATGATAWTRQLKGSNTTLVGNDQPFGLSYDTGRNILYVARSNFISGGAILAYHNADNAAVVQDNVAPTRVFTGAGPVTFLSPADVFSDSANDRLYVADSITGEIHRFNAASTAPSWIGFLGGIDPVPVAIFADISRDVLYVVRNQVNNILAYQNFSLPATAITIDASAVGLVDVKVDTASDTAYCSDFTGGRIFVIENVSTKSGTVPPNRTITGLSSPGPIFLDKENDQLFVTASDRVVVLDNLATINGNVAPFVSRELTGFAFPQGITGFYR